MSWLIIIILAYFLLALSALGDKFFLTKHLAPKSYTFYTGVLGGAVLFLIPFVNFSLPGYYNLFISFATGAVFVLAIFVFYQGLEKFEVSRIVPAIGGLLPIFTLIVSFLFFKEKIFLDFKIIFSFLFLVLGTFLITREPAKKFSFGSFKISLLCALLFSFFFVLSKYIFTILSFWNGLISIRIGALIAALLFIFAKEVRRDVSSIKLAFKNKGAAIMFLLNQGAAGLGGILQNLAIAIAGISFLAIINALEGIRYVFVFIFSLFLSKKFPDILKEEITGKIVRQKTIAIILIVVGLSALTL